MSFRTPNTDTMTAPTTATATATLTATATESRSNRPAVGRRRTAATALVAGAGLLGLWAAPPAGAQEPTPETAAVTSAEPAPPVHLATGSLLGVLPGGQRLVTVPDPNGPRGCEGAPADRLVALGPEGTVVDVDPVPGVTLSAGGNTLLTGPGAKVALVEVCEGFLVRIVTATATAAGIETSTTVEPGNGDGMLRITGWTADGTALLGARSSFGSAGAPRAVLVDPTNGATVDLGRSGWWVGQLADGTVVTDHGDHLQLGETEVPLGPGEAGSYARYLAVDPTGTRVAVGTPDGLQVIAADGTADRWTPTPVAGQLAWSPDGSAIAFPTSGEDGFAGTLVTATATAEGAVTTVARDIVVFAGVAWSRVPGDPTLVATTSDPTRPRNPTATFVTQVELQGPTAG